jgi:pimeloyl-ACP methyl ester carboxylesterase
VTIKILLACVLICSSTTAAWSQGGRQVNVVTLKNGLQYEGAIARVPDYNLGGNAPDATGQALIVMVDDGLRRIFFNQNLIGPQIADAERSESEFEIWQRKMGATTSGAGNLVSVGPFDEFGHRTLSVRNAKGQVEHYVQGITKITPIYCEVDTLTSESLSREWNMRVATSAVNPEVLRGLLRKQVMNPDKPNEYLAIVDFYLQSKQYQRALDELELIWQAQPGLKQQFEPIRLRILAEYGRQILAEARTRDESGQSQLALGMIGALNKEEMPEELQIEMDDLRQEIEGRNQLVEQTRRKVNDFLHAYRSKPETDPKNATMLQEFLSELETELRPSNVDRLASFVRLSEDETMAVEQKVSLALSGWLLGSNNVLDNFAVSASLWPTRALVREYLSTADAVRRETILGQLNELEGADPKYIAAMLSQMLPVTSPPLGGYTGKEPISLSFTIPIPVGKGGGEERIELMVQLPPQYDPYRRYPCILSLPGGRTPEEQLVYWTGDYNPVLEMRQGHAARQGFIVASVDWKSGGRITYDFSAREHLLVLKAVRMLLRSFSVDSDRLFLAGHFEGARAAFDVATAHPDQFAGVIGVSGGMGKYIERYKDNQHVGVPVYCVVGARDQFRSSLVQPMNLWLGSKMYNEATLIEYKGRLAEEFFEEVPEIFKWCKVHRRRWPAAGEDFDLDCKALRPGDTWFWFWEFNGIPDQHIRLPEDWAERGLDPLKITATLKANQPNFIRVGPSSTGSGGTLWLYPELVDFTKELQIGDRGTFKGFVKPNRKTMLEDVRRRGDRQRPFWAKVVCEGKRWTADE